MPSIFSLLSKLRCDFPAINFASGNEFYWSSSTQTVFYNEGSDETALLLHELAHGLLGHVAYRRDVELLAIERQAWDYAITELAPRYAIKITEDDIEHALDSYRDWLHARSTCPNCHATGIQTGQKQYRCLACHKIWSVNEARQCALRRYTRTI